MNVEDAYKVILMRGIPGSGKSTAARFLAKAEGHDKCEFWKFDSVLYYGQPALSLKVEQLSKAGQEVSISDSDYPHESEIYCAIHSTDEYFMVGDEYKYMPAKIGLYHSKNYKAFRESIIQKIPLVIVDNTNTTQSEYAKYQNYAVDMDYQVSFHVLPHPTVDEAVSRNKHGVPRDVIEKMRKRFT